MRHPPPRAVPMTHSAKLAVLTLVGALAWACQALPQLVQESSSARYTVGGGVTGANASLTVQCGIDSQVLVGAGAFTCSQTFASDSNYAVTVLVPPRSQSCLVTHGNGQVTNSNITSVVIACGVSVGIGVPATPTPTPSTTPSPSTTVTPTPTPRRLHHQASRCP